MFSYKEIFRSCWTSTYCQCRSKFIIFFVKRFFKKIRFSSHFITIPLLILTESFFLTFFLEIVWIVNNLIMKLFSLWLTSGIHVICCFYKKFQIYAISLIWDSILFAIVWHQFTIIKEVLTVQISDTHSKKAVFVCRDYWIELSTKRFFQELIDSNKVSSWVKASIDAFVQARKKSS